MKIGRILALVVVIVGIVLGWSVWVHYRTASNVQTLGIVMPLSGELAEFGLSTQRGVEVALAQQHEHMDAWEIVAEDTQGFSSQGALSGVRRLVDLYDTPLIVGPFGPAQVLAVAPILKEHTDTTVIGMSNCDARIMEYDRLFCVYPSIEAQVQAALARMDNEGIETVYLITEQSEFGALVERLLADNSSPTLVGVEKVVPNETGDMRTPITKMVLAEPDAVFAILAPNEGFVFLRQYGELSKGVPLFISSDVTESQVIDIFGEEAPGITFVSRLSEDYDPEFVRAYRDSYGVEPDYFAALAHSSSRIALDAFVGGSQHATLARDMRGRVVQGTAIKGFSFGPDGGVTVPLVHYIFRNGALQEYNS